MHINDTDTQALGRLTPGKPLADAQQQLEDDGYLLVEGLCDPEFVVHLLEVSLNRSDQVMSALGAQSIGIAGGSLQASIDYTRERQQFGRPVSEFQGVQFQIAEMAVQLEAARLMVYNAARLKDAGQPFVTPAAMAKLYASEMAQRVASTCIDLHGGYGFTKEYPVEKLYRDAKIGTIYEGTSNMQKQTIAKALMR